MSEWYFIEHQPEEDERKRHIHLFVVPSKMLQTDDLIDEFAQPDPEKPGKVLTCTLWRSSKFADWYLYAIHDKAYLAGKGQSRKYHYRRDDVAAFDSDALDDCIREIELTSLSMIQRMQDAQKSGLSFGEFFRLGGVPLQSVYAHQAAWDLLLGNDTIRGDRVSHTPKIDAETGEVVSDDVDA